MRSWMTAGEYKRRMAEQTALYRAYREEGGEEDAARWFAFFGDKELFNEWQGRRQQSSYPVSVKGGVMFAPKPVR